jgi:cation transport regulator ChaC
MSQQYLFAYGSLLHDLDAPAGSAAAIACRLAGHRRVWNVAMDNTLTVPGYKCYLDPRDGSRPAVFVSFLNLRPAPGQSVNGVLFPILSADLPALDRRERNYRRVELTGSIETSLAGRVWSYLGKAEAERRFDRALQAGRAVIHKGYLELVREGFARLGPEELAEFETSTDPPRCPVVELQRVELD